MDNLLKFIGLKKSFKINLDSDNIEFVKLLEKDIKPNQSFFFDIFDSTQKKYYGKVNLNEFELRLAQRSLFPKCPFARAFGEITGGQKNTKLDVSIIGWNWFILLFMLFMGLIFGLSLNDILNSKSYGVLVLIVPMFLIFILIPIFKMRNGAKRFEDYLKAELTKLGG